jgi:hypothetical protein
MKHIKTFENFNANQTNEEIEWLKKIIGTSKEDRKKDFESKLQPKIRSWVSKGVIDQPTEEEMTSFISAADIDNYAGSVQYKDKKLVYVNSKDTKAAPGMAGHNFGGGA